MAIDDRKSDTSYLKWASLVKQKDHFQCQICNRKNCYIESHHILNWADYPDERYSISNGITLCSECHKAYHSVAGHRFTTQESFDEFQQVCEILLKIAERKSEVETATQQILQTIDGYIAKE